MNAQKHLITGETQGLLRADYDTLDEVGRAPTPTLDSLAEGRTILEATDPMPVQPHKAVYCHGCGHAWWADEECECSCVEGDVNYETWAVGSPVGFEILWARGPHDAVT